MSKDKTFDLDKFVDQLELEDGFDLDEQARFTECPRCGSDTWDKLYYTKRGVESHCNECRDEHEQ